MIEGGSSKDFMKTKLFAYQQPDLFDELIEILTNSTAQYLINQVEAGAEALQIFDSWAGALDAESFEKYSIEPIKKIISLVREKYPDIPIIGFPKGAGTGLIKFAKQTGITAIGLDSQTHPQWAAQNLQSLIPVQGNLDPMMLMAGGEKMQKAAALIMENFASKPYIFNLGHGIHKDTPIAHVEKLVETLRG